MAVRSGSDYLVLYGTLRRSQAPHRRLGLERKLNFLSVCRVAGTLVDLGRYPGFLNEGEGQVAGDLFEIRHRPALDELDAYEGFYPANLEASRYVRALVPVMAPADWAEREAWIYVYNQVVPEGRVIEGGDWLRHKAASLNP